jgi:hypothetical protein
LELWSFAIASVSLVFWLLSFTLSPLSALDPLLAALESGLGFLFFEVLGPHESCSSEESRSELSETREAITVEVAEVLAAVFAESSVLLFREVFCPFYLAQST